MERTAHLNNGTVRTSVRALFLSDLHLGSPHAQADLCLDVLDTYEPEYLYLVGDILDGWKLKRKWYWSADTSTVLQKVCQLADRGTRVFYTPGNHDDFLRSPEIKACLRFVKCVEVDDSFIHRGANGRKLFVTHGDLFDPVESQSRWLSKLGSIGFDLLLSLDTLWSRLRGRQGVDRYALSLAIKRRVKGALSIIPEFRDALLQHAEFLGCDGVVCGHIHTPALHRIGHMTYCNTGDWIGTCTYILERLDGRLDLLQHQTARPDRLLATNATTARVEEPVLEEANERDTVVAVDHARRSGWHH